MTDDYDDELYEDEEQDGADEGEGAVEKEELEDWYGNANWMTRKDAEERFLENSELARDDPQFAEAFEEWRGEYEILIDGEDLTSEEAWAWFFESGGQR